ncbi:MAG TPA: IclR family transcriptional regulator [Pyrinomonadaceae bacterium]
MNTVLLGGGVMVMSRAAVAKSQEFVKRNGSREQVTSVERALSILELLASRNHGLSTSEISRAAKVPKSSTSYLLRTLVGRGYVHRDLETGQHTLGIRVLSLGGQAMQGMALRELAMPHLRQIVETTRLGSHLAILDHGEAVYIERIESPGFIKMDIWNGRRVAPQVTAVGKALICQLSREEVQEIAGLHPVRPVSARTIVTLPHLLEDLAAIRRRGYAIDDEEHAVGVRCVAAPVFAATGEVVAAIGVSGTVSQMNDDHLHSFGKIVQTIALKLSAQLGGRRSR